MSERDRRTAAAIALAAAVTGTALLGATGSATAAPAAKGSSHGTLTISNGTKKVFINGRWVDFGVKVTDLAWSPNGAKAAFIDGSGNLDVANPDGSGRVVVAKNPGGWTWSHPTWQVSPGDRRVGIPAKDNLIFASYAKGTARLEYVSATAVHGTPKALSLFGYPGPGGGSVPQTGNVWPNAAGSHGTSVYANVNTGDVYIRDDYLRQMGGVVTKGREPALSPNEEEIVFVRSVAGHDHILEEDLNNHSVRDLTPHATTDYTTPAWSSDGTTIAARTHNGTVTVPANGSADPTKVTSAVGMPAYRR
ncbi:hypothetical protein ACFOSC_30805 [Streptantibioticus rubrisoli]|uniref:WD40 repeat protein n=1 Tax=Streptantibioticus rubrisoli TaxID=1387313 RepID=A0ABT1PLY1_9ACTN|nr:hypothetical protein [Streptantibioticus rubrisoli]MCQ4045300.1 hypothetical protein [Streptantibioticus rubrisoli]